MMDKIEKFAKNTMSIIGKRSPITMENEEVTKTEETTGVSKTDKAIAYGLAAGGLIGIGYLVKDKVIPFVKKTVDKIKMQKANKAKNLSEPVAENETKKK